MIALVIDLISIVIVIEIWINMTSHNIYHMASIDIQL